MKRMKKKITLPRPKVVIILGSISSNTNSPSQLRSYGADLHDDKFAEIRELRIEIKNRCWRFPYYSDDV